MSETIRETPLGAYIGATLVEITSEDVHSDDLLETEGTTLVHLHFSNGGTVSFPVTEYRGFDVTEIE